MQLCKKLWPDRFLLLYQYNAAYLVVPEVSQNFHYFCFCKHQHRVVNRNSRHVTCFTMWLRTSQWAQIKGANHSKLERRWVGLSVPEAVMITKDRQHCREQNSVPSFHLVPIILLTKEKKYF